MILPPPRQARPNHGHGDLHSLSHVGRAADDLQRLTRLGVDPAQAQFLGVRVGLDRLDMADDYAAELGSRGLYGIHLETRHGQLLGQRRGIHIRVYPLTQP